MKKIKVRTYKLIHARDVFRVSLIVIVLTLLFVWLAGLGMHHTFFENSILSLTILSIAFFGFITIGLYKGYKLRHVEEKQEAKKGESNFPDNVVDLLPSGNSVDFVDVESEGCVGAIAALLLWILTAVIIAALLWFFANVIVVVILLFMGMLYWIFFRAIRLVFKNSPRCKSDFLESVKVGLSYTVLYNFWIYGIFLLVHYMGS